MKLKLLVFLFVSILCATTVVAQEVSPGPCLEKRKQLRDYLVKAKKTGMGTAPYEKLLAQIESDVQAGKNEEEIKKSLASLTSALSQQVSSFKAMKAAPPAYRVVTSRNSSGAPTSTTGPMTAPGMPRSGTGRRASTDEMEAYMVGLVNKHRQQNGLGSLSSDSALAAIARGHALDMVKRHFFDHTNPSGESPRDRARAAGYTGNVRENIAFTNQMNHGLVMVEYCDDSLMKSPGHKANILAPYGTNVGIGIVFDASGGISVCQLFSP